MKKYYKNNEGSLLIHSDIYLGEDYTSKNLVHYKYIKRERKGARWLYYYENKNSDSLNLETYKNKKIN